jgi:hypothetical protein
VQRDEPDEPALPPCLARLGAQQVRERDRGDQRAREGEDHDVARRDAQQTHPRDGKDQPIEPGVTPERGDQRQPGRCQRGGSERAQRTQLLPAHQHPDQRERHDRAEVEHALDRIV